jgi:hypothetical protein
MDRKNEQADLIRKLGAFLAPLEDLVRRPAQFDSQALARVFARVFVERDAISGAMSRFADGEPGHRYRIQNNQFHSPLNEFMSFVYNKNDTDSLKHALEKYIPAMQAANLEVPVEGVCGILEAGSPFTAYCRLKDISCATLQTLVCTDRYFDASVFHRYLREVREAATVTLVTLDAAKITSTKDRARHSEFMDVSRLFAAERGSDRYRLIGHPDFHDRWMRCDGQLYALGGSVKDASQKSDYAIARSDPTAENMKKIVDLVTAGTELFGPGNRTHP